MSRISLKEMYDNKDVIKQIYVLKDTTAGYDERLDGLDEKTDATDARMSAAENRLTADEADIAQLKLSDAEHTEQISTHDKILDNHAAEITALKQNDVKQDSEIAGLTESVVSDLTGTFDNTTRNLHLSIEREQAASIDLDVVIPASGETGIYSPGEGIAISDANVISISSDLDATIKQLKISDEENTSAIAQAQKDISANVAEVALLKSTVAQHTNQIGTCFNEFSVADGKLSMTNVQGQTYEQTLETGNAWKSLNLSDDVQNIIDILSSAKAVRVKATLTALRNVSSWSTAPTITAFAINNLSSVYNIFNITYIQKSSSTNLTMNGFITIGSATTKSVIEELETSMNLTTGKSIKFIYRAYNAGGVASNTIELDQDQYRYISVEYQ